jgi:uncharacterized membrane protein YgcG
MTGRGDIEMKTSAMVRSAVLTLALSMLPAASQAGVFVSVAIAPPVLPVYVQPAIPAPGYLWTPGYWAYGPDGYFWVPGTWVLPPQPGVLWTPGYWGWRGGLYVWNAGYWGPHVGFYGGVNYGFGYGGVGFFGGRWAGGVFSYNAAAWNVGGGVVVNSYHENVVVNNIHTSYNGGAGGVRAEPNAAERSAMAEHHMEPTREQLAHHEAASHDRSNFASVNHGHPANAAMSRPRTMAAANHSPAAGNHANSPAGRSGNAGGRSGSPAGRSGAPAAANHNSSGGSGRSGAGGPSHANSAAPHAPAKAPSGGQSHSSGGNGGNKGGGGAKAAPKPAGKK